jgi:Fe2+ transport system protein B
MVRMTGFMACALRLEIMVSLSGEFEKVERC